MGGWKSKCLEGELALARAPDNHLVPWAEQGPAHSYHFCLLGDQCKGLSMAQPPSGL